MLSRPLPAVLALSAPTFATGYDVDAESSELDLDGNPHSHSTTSWIQLHKPLLEPSNGAHTPHRKWRQPAARSTWNCRRFGAARMAGRCSGRDPRLTGSCLLGPKLAGRLTGLVQALGLHLVRAAFSVAAPASTALIETERSFQPIVRGPFSNSGAAWTSPVTVRIA
jgi:hypothetical protein